MDIGPIDSAKIQKKILHSGREFKRIHAGTRVFFHFETRKKDDPQQLIDDSRKMGKPMELVIGKKFKLEVWETIIQAMAIGEVASFTVDKTLLYSYPLVSKTLRDAQKPEKGPQQRCCGHALQTYGLGYNDLNDLMKSPCDLEFIIELLKVESDGEYERDVWQLNEEDRLNEVPKLREEGNNLYKEGKFDEAAEKYSKAIGFLDQLMLMEKPGETEWNKLNAMKLPLLLNFSQCKLSTNDYYQVIEHCTTVLQYDPDNVKALFRRGKAYAAVWSSEEARADLEKAAKIDPGLQRTVQSLIKDITARMKDKEVQLKEQLRGKLF